MRQEVNRSGNAGFLVFSEFSGYKIWNIQRRRFLFYTIYKIICRMICGVVLWGHFVVAMKYKREHLGR